MIGNTLLPQKRLFNILIFWLIFGPLLEVTLERNYSLLAPDIHLDFRDPNWFLEIRFRCSVYFNTVRFTRTLEVWNEGAAETWQVISQLGKRHNSENGRCRRENGINLPAILAENSAVPAAYF